MTARKTAPHSTLNSINTAAENLQTAIRLQQMVMFEDLPRVDRTVKQAKTLDQPYNALRYLESIGAQTRP